jgi:hypothetical protein
MQIAVSWEHKGKYVPAGWIAKEALAGAHALLTRDVQFTAVKGDDRTSKSFMIEINVTAAPDNL